MSSPQGQKEGEVGLKEERIDETLKSKRKLFADLIDDVTLDISRALTADELFQLFGLTSPRPKPS